MIRLGPSPAIDLASDPRIREARHRLFEYLRRPAAERAERRIPLDDGLFYDDRLTEAVRTRSFGKCAFCEQSSDGIVDHFRPIRDARDLHEVADRDFYAWLAFEFDNLIFLCRACAHSKGTFFPVFGERAPYIASLTEVRRLEEPMLLDPARDQVDRYFDFLCDGWCEPLEPRGRVTASLLRLNREELLNGRGESIAALLTDLEGAIIDPGYPQRLRELFDVRLPFAGARYNILQRLLRGVTFRGKSLSGAVQALPDRLDELLLKGITGAERQRLIQRLMELREEDKERERWTGELGVELDPPPPRASTPWAGVPRTGGLSLIEIQDFRGIGELQLNIPPRRLSSSAPCLMLLGENAVGKSSVLQAVALTLLGGPQARRLRLVPADFLRSPPGGRWDQLTPNDASAKLSFRFERTIKFRLNAEDGRIEGGDAVASIVLGYGPRRYFDRKRSERGMGAYERVATLFSATATIPYPETWLNQLQPEEFAEVAQIVRIVLALSDDDELVRDLDGRICIRLEGHPVPLEWLSEGYRSVFAMVADMARELLPRFPILQDAEAIVLIDEIETHLHPRWKMRVMGALRRAFPAVTFIVTTHDPLCLRGMDDGEVAVLQRRVDGTIVKLEGLPSIKGMRADQLLTSDYFGLSSTIDPKTELDMAKYVAAVSDLPPDRSGEADRLVQHLTIGDDAQEQIIHEALRKFIAERERPVASLRPDLSKEAVQAVLSALRDDDFE